MYGEILQPVITVNRNQLNKIINALHSVERAVRVEREELPYRCAVDYIGVVYKNITQGTYAGGYAPYSPRYAKWKVETMQLGSTFWILGRDLLKAITVIKKRWGYVGGIPMDAMDSGGKSWYGKGKVGKKKKIGMYGKTIEFGLGKQPARPVFEPSGHEYADKGWKEEGDASLKKIEDVWR